MARKARPAAKTHDEIFASMVEGLDHAIGIARGEADPVTYRVHVPFEVDVKAVRRKTGLSQEAFAGAFGFSAGTVRDWEQKRRAPDQAARMYLWAIGQRPDTMREILDPLTGKPAATIRPSRSSSARSAECTVASRNATPQRPKRASRH
ncbi:MAG TPA: helix-turn-helix domain-containing protein [Rhizomicrobium sp.]|jgi:putative transcriptional regulator